MKASGEEERGRRDRERAAESTQGIGRGVQLEARVVLRTLRHLSGDATTSHLQIWHQRERSADVSRRHL